jgi:hypothetical protein
MGHHVLAAAALLAMAGAAHASAPFAGVAIDNEFDEAVKVYVGQDYLGTVLGEQDRTFRVRAGYTPIRVMYGDDTLVSTSVRLLPGTVTHVDVEIPRVPVEIANRGRQPVLVALGGRSTWIGPGDERTLTLRAGEREVQTWVSSHRGGLREVESFEVRLDVLDRDQRIVVSDTPLPGTLTVDNHERQSMMVFVDGRERGTVTAGRSLDLDVEPGSVRVMLVSHDGDLRIYDTVDVDRGETTELQLGMPSVVMSRPVCMMR